MRVKTILFTGAVFLVGAAILAGVRLYNKPHRSVVSTSADYHMTAPELVRAFVNDEVDANARYGGKIVVVTGTVRELFPDSKTVILVVGDSTMDAAVSCYLQNGQSVQPERLQPGSMVTVKGICNGMLIDVMVDDAVVVTSKTTELEL